MKRNLLKLGTSVLVVMLFVFFAQSCSATKSVDKAQLDGYWVLKTFEGKVVTESFKGNIPTIEFDFEKNEVFGSAGCNRYFGAFAIEGDLFKAPNIASTMMACLEDNKEGRFLEILSSKEDVKISVENNILTFGIGGKSLLVFEKGTKAESAVEQ